MIHSLFAAICKQHSDKIAIVSKGEHVTYQQLYDHTERMCSLILDKMETPIHETPIGFCLSRGWKLISVMMAIMKVGGCYVPFDPSYPIERLTHILHDVNPALMIIDEFVPPIFLDKLVQKSIVMVNESAPKISVQPNDSSTLAYIIYTSGSSGKPKGVMIEQHSIINFIKSASRLCHVTSNSRLLSYISMGFDAAGWDIYLSILNGATLYIADDEICLSPGDIHKCIKNNNITMVSVTPAFLSLMPKEDLPSLSMLVVMGDMADSKNMEFWCDGNRTVVNGYGPTETTIGATLHFFKNGDDPSVIGKPFDGYDLYIFDECMNTCSEGELFIGGLGVARGYFGMSDYTNQKFVETKYGRLYKTGDLVRMNCDGNLEFLGRVDNQVKIRGVRIEIEEIESLVGKISNISQWAVRCFTNSANNQKYLVVYYCSNGKNLGQQIRLYLQEHLHPAVVPSHYVSMTHLPMNVHGKVDRMKLEPPSIKNTSYEPPKTPLEKIVVDILEQVFQMDGLGRDANFLELGGHSMVAQMVSSLLSQSGYNISVSDILRHPVVSEFAEYIKPECNPKHLCINETLEPLPLTSTQIEVWNHQRLDPQSPLYNLPLIFSIKGTLDVSALESTLSTVFNQHFALRCVIEMNDGRLQQSPKHEFSFNLEPKIVHPDFMLSEATKIIQHPFCLSDGPLVRVEILRNSMDEKHHVLIIVKHAIVIDSFSERFLLEKISNLYCTEISVGNKNDFASYRNFVLDNSISDRDVEYWNNYLNGFVPLVLKGDKEQNGGMRTKKTFNIGTKLQTYCALFHCTPYAVLLSALNLMLLKYTGQCDISIGTEVALRGESYVSNTVGLLVLPMIARNKINPKMTLSDLIEQVTTNIHKSMDHTRIGFRDILSICKQFSEMHPATLMFVMQNIESDSKLVLKDTKVERIDLHHDSNMFPMCWNVYLDNGRLLIDVEHSCIYSGKFVNSMLRNYGHILEQLLDKLNRCTPVSKVSTLSKDELSCINKIGHGEVLGGPETLSITAEIDRRATETPNFAVIRYSTPDGSFMDGTLTYFELNNMSNHLAHIIMNQFGVKCGDRVGICMNRSCDMVVVMLAILKVGACYIPMDPTYPINRLNYMIEDSCPVLVIATRKSSLKLEKAQNILVLDDILLEKTLRENIEHSTPNSIAYIIYTSGSTGAPKACIIRHNSIMNVAQYFSKRLNLRKSDKVWNLTSISFDIMALEVFMPLVIGCQLMVCPVCVASNPVDLVDWINAERPTVLQATPTLFSLIGTHIQPNNDMTILVGGEALTSKICENLLMITSKVYNVYGPSETTIWSLCKKIESCDSITIGKPISNTVCYVMDENLNLVPRGSVGELFIGGIGVADGYWMKNELTKQRFVDTLDGRLYRTGDLVKLNFDGEFEFLGRTDFQVKIRGHRIEVNELIATIESHPCVKRAVVMTRTILGQQHLVAYYMSDEEQNVRSHIESRRLFQ